MLVKIKWSVPLCRLLRREAGNLSSSVWQLTLGTCSYLNASLHPASMFWRPNSLDFAMPSWRGKISLKCHWCCPDWHRDTAPSQFTLLISERSKGVRVKWELLQCWVQQQTILQKWECSDNCSVNLLLSHILKNLDYCNPFSFPLLSIFWPPTLSRSSDTGVLDIDCGLVTQFV